MGTALATGVGQAITSVAARAFTVPTDAPESDGTISWDSTTLVVCQLQAGDETGLGYSYADAGAAGLIERKLAPLLEGEDPFAIGALWHALGAALRNVGRPGIGFMALSAVDIALWDLKARLLELPLVALLPRARDAAPIYGSGGFTSYSPARLREQLGGWVEEGIPRVKMKVSRNPADDPARLTAVREAIGPETELLVDSNGALTRKQALLWADRFAAEWQVSWYEEPVSSADLTGLRLLRDRAPAGLDIAAGEYAFVPADFRNLIEAGAVDCLQADATRCGGITGFLQAGHLAAAHELDLSGHTAPQVHAHACCAVPRLRHLEYFHDHVRVERLLFDGVLEPEGGCLVPDRSRPGLGLALKEADAAEYEVRT